MAVTNFFEAASTAAVSSAGSLLGEAEAEAEGLAEAELAGAELAGAELAGAAGVAAGAVCATSGSVVPPQAASNGIAVTAATAAIMEIRLFIVVSSSELVSWPAPAHRHRCSTG